LIALDDIAAGGERAVGGLDLAARFADFDALQPQDVHELRGSRHLALHGDDEPVGRILPARLDRVLRLLIEVLDDEVREGCRELERAEDAGLHVVGVVAT
jgi:hypothetical protein